MPPDDPYLLSADQQHVVKVSGGRSSAYYMLRMILEPDGGVSCFCGD